MAQTTRMQFSRKHTMVAVVVALTLLLLYMQGVFVPKVSPGSVSAAGQTELPADEKVVVTKQQIDNMMAWPGTVKSRTVASIAPKITARILEINVNAGDAVKKGDVIARLDGRDSRAQEQAVVASLAGVIAEADRAGADEARIRSLYEKEAATRENLDAVVARAKEARARVSQATSTVRAARVQLADTLLLAPFDGIVVKRLKQPGDMGLPGVPLVTMQLPTGLRLEVDVPGTCTGEYQVGMDVTVRIDTLQKKVIGRIDEINPEIDANTHTQLIKIALPAMDGLKPGYYGWLEQSCEQHEALLIPVGAVRRIGQLEVVQVLSEGQLQTRHVRTAKVLGDRIEVISGLHAGETVMIPRRVQ